MQRRAAAGYIVLFLLLAVGAFATLSTASAPVVSFQDPDADLRTGDSLTVDGRQYTVSGIDQSESGGDGHGETETTSEATFSWTNESARFTESWTVGDEVSFDNATYTFLETELSEPRRARFRGQLGDDVATYERDGTTYVIVNQSGDRQESVALSEYEGVERRSLQVGAQISYDGRNVTIDRIENGSVTLAWRAPETTEQTVSQHGNVTLNGVTYLAHFPSEGRVQLTRNFQSFERQQSRITTFEERMNGLRGVVVLSGVAIVLLAGLAFLPVRE